MAGSSTALRAVYGIGDVKLQVFGDTVLALVRRWCDEVGKHHGIHLVGMSVAYENYFSNLTSLEAKTIAFNS